MIMSHVQYVLAPKGIEVLKMKAVSEHPNDAHLAVVFAKKGDEYVTWLYNESDKGVHSGHYYNSDEYYKAWTDFIWRT